MVYDLYTVQALSQPRRLMKDSLSIVVLHYNKNIMQR